MARSKEFRMLNPETYKKVVCERRFMIAATVCTIIFAILFIIAVATTGWITVRLEYKDGLVKICYIGIWGEWVSSHMVRVRNNETDALYYMSELVADTVKGSFVETWVNHFPSPPREMARLIRDINLSHYYRTQAVFSIIAIVLMICANSCGIYSLTLHHRYMYKRLTAGLHAFTAMCVLIVIEVMIHSVNKWHLEIGDLRESKDWDDRKGHDQNDYLDQKTTFGYSTVISWLVFAVYVIAAVIFILGSRKRKGSRSATEDFEVADRPIVIGR